ncbi:MAG: ATP-binding protein [Erysipelotrichaceae bacterium]|nr:ATP-binding protein [Erysipelotrichaceae bacterium]
MNNPFTLSFGKIPNNYIRRPAVSYEIVNSFLGDNPSFNSHIITGVRGSGKTVLLTEISGSLKENENWIVADLNPEQDMLLSLYSKLMEEKPLKTSLKKVSLNLLGMDLSLERSVPDKDIETAIEELLKVVKKNGQKLLITIDEVANNKEIKRFCSSFQIFLRHDYPVFLLMTGLYENINAVINSKTMTFLLRTPKTVLGPLDLASITETYEKTLSVEKEEALKLARLSKGYAFAFQTIGYLYYKSETKSIDAIISEFDYYLREFVYRKINEDLSVKDRLLLSKLSCDTPVKTKDLIDNEDFNEKSLSVYRNRLKEKGLIDVSQHGMMSLSLPRFDVFLKNYEQ